MRSPSAVRAWSSCAVRAVRPVLLASPAGAAPSALSEESAAFGSASSEVAPEGTSGFSSKPGVSSAHAAPPFALLVVDDLGVDDVVVGLGLGLAGARRHRRAWAAWASAYIAWPSFWLTAATFSVAVRISAVSSPLSVSFSSATAVSTSVLTSPGTLSSLSLRNFSVW